MEKPNGELTPGIEGGDKKAGGEKLKIINQCLIYSKKTDWKF